MKKLTVLERYHQKGWLDEPKSPWSADDRLRQGLWLRNVREKSGLGAISAVNYEQVKVDCAMRQAGLTKLTNESLFIKATEFIPKEFLDVVLRVCCDDKPIKATGKTNQEVMSNRYLQRKDLCRGLDYVVNFVLYEKKKYF